MTTLQLPYITSDLPGIGGEIKAEPEHFVVEEVPLYEPSGEGSHLFVRITRAGQTTQEVVKNLARTLEIEASSIGYAGLKDKQALVTQTFSLPQIDISLLERACAELDLTLHWAIPHGKKLKKGHLLGNRFTITLLHPSAPQPLPQAQAIIDALLARGLPNYFGEQRFGQFGDNAEQGLAILTGQRPRPRARWLYSLLTSAYQSQLFNDYLSRRIAHGYFQQLMSGDLAKKTDTGGMFLVQDLASEQARFEQREITFTGPLFGYKMRQPEADAAAFEAETLATSPVTAAQWRQHRVTGNRRVGRIFLAPISLEPHPSGLALQFYLPKGAYATILLREIIKSDSDK